MKIVNKILNIKWKIRGNEISAFCLPFGKVSQYYDSCLCHLPYFRHTFKASPVWKVWPVST